MQFDLTIWYWIFVKYLPAVSLMQRSTSIVVKYVVHWIEQPFIFVLNCQGGKRMTVMSLSWTAINLATLLCYRSKYTFSDSRPNPCRKRRILRSSTQTNGYNTNRLWNEGKQEKDITVCVWWKIDKENGN